MKDKPAEQENDGLDAEEVKRKSAKQQQVSKKAEIHKEPRDKPELDEPHEKTIRRGTQERERKEVERQK